MKKNRYKVVLYFLCLLGCVFFCSCENALNPVESTESASPYEFNYWLLSKTYLYAEELDSLSTVSDSVPLLYKSLSDPYTRYYPPSKSEYAENHINTSIVEGDLGMEYLTLNSEDENSHPIIIYRVYEDSPAGRAHVPRYGVIVNANGINLVGSSAKSVYDSIVDYSQEVVLVVSFRDSLKVFDLVKETVFAPTVFLDTISGITFVTITEFKSSTANRELGTFGELKRYLDSTTNENNPRVLDLRYNPGGLISQCLSAADLFVKSGLLSERRFITLAPDGKSVHKTARYMANSGDSGENNKFIVLANKGSASCAEIFIAAVQEQGKIPFVGTTTFGKGIGQSQWKTVEGGLAVITNLEFFTPLGNSYHKKGIEPDFECSEGATRNCALEAISSIYSITSFKNNSASLKQKIGNVFFAEDSLKIFFDKKTYSNKNFFIGGAIDSSINFVNYPYSL